jgi:uncharacterized protein DUF547
MGGPSRFHDTSEPRDRSRKDPRVSSLEEKMTTLLLSVALVCACAPGERQLDPDPTAETTIETASARDFDHEHTLLTEILKANTQGGDIDYRALKKNPAKLDAYLAGLRAVSPKTMKGWTRDQRFAFWINTYNAYTIQLVRDNYPVKSIKSIGGLLTSVWDKAFIPMNAHHPKGKDKKLTLNHIEHDILRPIFKDARVHAAINCASKSCPPLRSEAYVASRLDQQLDEQVRIWLADPCRNRFDRKAGRLHLSKIFDWFAKDFRRDGGSVQGWVAKYAPEKAATWLKGAKEVRISYLDYSWKLNDVKHKD